jgi:hypothetical protein
MSDRWQQISLRLDAELAQALREMKQGHDESLSEVVIRMLKKVVRQSTAGARGAPMGRSVPRGRTASRGRTGRGAVGAGSDGKPRRIGGKVAKVPRSQQLEGSSEPRKRNVRAGTAGPRSMRPSDALGAAEDSLKAPRKPRGRRSTGL